MILDSSALIAAIMGEPGARNRDTPPCSPVRFQPFLWRWVFPVLDLQAIDPFELAGVVSDQDHVVG